MSFEISIDIQCSHRHAAGEWFNIFHFTTGGNHGQFGNRFFSIWQHEKSTGKLHIVINDVGGGHFQKGYNPNCVANQWNTYQFTQRQYQSTVGKRILS